MFINPKRGPLSQTNSSHPSSFHHPRRSAIVGSKNSKRELNCREGQAIKYAHTSGSRIDVGHIQPGCRLGYYIDLFTGVRGNYRLFDSPRIKFILSLCDGLAPTHNLKKNSLRIAGSNETLTRPGNNGHADRYTSARVFLEPGCRQACLHPLEWAGESCLHPLAPFFWPVSPTHTYTSADVCMLLALPRLPLDGGPVHLCLLFLFTRAGLIPTTFVRNQPSCRCLWLWEHLLFKRVSSHCLDWRILNHALQSGAFVFFLMSDGTFFNQSYA